MISPSSVGKKNSFVTFNKLGELGRLGNQMWQVAAVAAYAAKHNVTPTLRQWICSYSGNDQTSIFPNAKALIWEKAGILYNAMMLAATPFNESGFHYTPIPYIKDVNLFGYFQSPKYFDHCKDEIQRLFEFASPYEAARIQYKFQNNISGTTVALHVRRGDYVGHQIHEVCSTDYYGAAIWEMEERLAATGDKYTLLIFSDDFEWIWKYMPSEPTQYGPLCKQVIKTSNTDVLSFSLMSGCDHQIIANSSFSWWASWLNPNPKKIVIAPDHWFADPAYANDKDVYADFMIKVKTK